LCQTDAVSNARLTVIVETLIAKQARMRFTNSRDAVTWARW
jgi:hypothetical protein